MKLIVIILFFGVSLVSNGQKTTLYFHIDKITIKEKTVVDSTNFKRYEKKALEKFTLNGYVGIQLKDSTVKNTATHYYYSYAQKFDKIELRATVGRKQRIKSTPTRHYFSAIALIEKEIVNLENSGFPFASINFTNQTEEKNKLILDYVIDSGNFFLIDKIHIKSEHNFHEKTILNLIGIEIGDKYNEEKIGNLGDLIAATKLYRLNRPCEVLFRKGKAELYIYIEKERSSTADGYIGFQQDQVTKKLALNGFINLKLHNALNHAEILDLNWKSNPDKTQNLKTNLRYPFLFNTPLGVGGSLNLRKQDSTFLRTDITLEISYYHPYARFTVFNQLESSITLRENAPSIYRNYRKNTIGATSTFVAPNLSRAPFYHPELFLLGGFYNYRDDTIDDNKQKISNAKYEFVYRHSVDFLKYFHLNNSVGFQGLTSNISLSRNELVYFGGLNSVRGFYELELAGNDIWTFLNEIEYRPIDLFSIFILYDHSSFHNAGYHSTNSFGLGFSLNGESNALEIVVANGVLDDNPLDLTNTKIHIGFKSTF